MRTDLADTTYTGHMVLAVSLELAAAKWMVALHDGRAIVLQCTPSRNRRLRCAFRQRWP
jgi:transposase